MAKVSHVNSYLFLNSINVPIEKPRFKCKFLFQGILSVCEVVVMMAWGGDRVSLQSSCPGNQEGMPQAWGVGGGGKQRINYGWKEVPVKNTKISG